MTARLAPDLLRIRPAERAPLRPEKKRRRWSSHNGERRALELVHLTHCSQRGLPPVHMRCVGGNCQIALGDDRKGGLAPR